LTIFDKQGKDARMNSVGNVDGGSWAAGRPVREGEAFVCAGQNATAALYIDEGMARLCELVDRDTPRDGAWAQEVCIVTREIHVAVWEWEAERSIVQDVVVPAFQRAHEAMVALSPSEEYPTDAYARNVMVRIKNLDRYVGGQESLIDPDDRLEDPAPTRSSRS